MAGKSIVVPSLHPLDIITNFLSYVARYDETQSHILRYHMAEPKVTLNIFGNGKITLMGQYTEYYIHMI